MIRENSKCISCGSKKCEDACSETYDTRFNSLSARIVEGLAQSEKGRMFLKNLQEFAKKRCEELKRIDPRSRLGMLNRCPLCINCKDNEECHIYEIHNTKRDCIWNIHIDVLIDYIVEKSIVL